MMTQNFNFYQECFKKYDQEIYNNICFVFNALPLAAILDQRFFIVHGGISPELKKVNTLNKINRFQEPTSSGIFCDILWSDPSLDQLKFSENTSRGCSVFYGTKSITKFLKENKLKAIIRAHEVQLDGYKIFNFGNENFPQIISIFSAPNYCGQYNNRGAFLSIKNSQINIQQFNYQQQPYCLPKYMNVFEFTMPFVSESIISIILNLLMQGTEEGNEETIEKFVQQEKRRKSLKGVIERKEQIKKKILFLAKMKKMENAVRVEREKILAEQQNFIQKSKNAQNFS